MCSLLRVSAASIALAWLVALAGCAGFDHRAAKNPALVGSLSPETLARLQAGDIQLGDTTAMVHLALGRPGETAEQITAAGRRLVWIYTDYWQEYEGTRMVGYRRLVVQDPVTKAARVIVEPDYRPVYTQRAEDRLKITFENDRVVVVEQAQPGASSPRP